MLWLGSNDYECLESGNILQVSGQDDVTCQFHEKSGLRLTICSLAYYKSDQLNRGAVRLRETTHQTRPGGSRTENVSGQNWANISGSIGPNFYYTIVGIRGIYSFSHWPRYAINTLVIKLYRILAIS